MIWTPLAHPLVIACAAVLGAAAVWIAWQRLAQRLPRRAALLITAPRVLVAALLVLALLDPGCSGSVATGGRSLVLVVDQSGSMELADGGGGSRRERAEALAERLARSAPAGVRIERRWLDTGLRREPATGGGGRGTDLAAGLQELARETGGDACLGVVLLSDGGDEPVGSPAGLPAAALSCVAVGSPAGRLDNLAVAAVTVPESVEKGVAFELTAELSARGGEGFLGRLAAVPVTVERRDANGVWQRLESAPVDLRQGRARQVFRLTLDQPGAALLRLGLEPQPGEASRLDNQRQLPVEVRQRSLHVLYFSRSLGIDFKQWRAELGRDAGLTLTALYRTLGERFSVQGDRLDGDQDLSAGFPSSAALARYDVVVLGSFPASAWSAEEQRRLADRVAAGGAVVFCGGDESFGAGGYAGSPLAELMPWQISAGEAPPLRGGFAVSLPPAVSHPVLRGLPEALAGVPPLASLNRPGPPRPGATVLLTAGSGAETVALAAVQPWGQGRVLGLASDTFWRLDRRGPGPSAYGFFWRQALRWLAEQAEGGRVLKVSFDRARYRPGETALATVRLAGEGVTPGLTARLAEEGGGERGLAVETSTEAGLSTIQIPFPRRGTWRLRLEASRDGQRIEDFEKTLVVAPTLDEGARLERDDAGLRGLAEARGGIFAGEEDPEPLLRWLAERVRSASIASTTSFAHGTPWFILLLVAALAVEWVLRRRRNLV